jgi:DHA3 family macrolide efflux protein-like MFS transporter
MESTRDWKRDFALFVASQTLSLLGSSLVQYAIVWYITLQTRSGLMMTLVTLVTFVPGFFLSPFAGVWADRHDRKKIIMLADGGIALVTLAMALVFMTGHREIWLLLVASALRAVGQAMQGPAVGAFLPQIVPQDRLLRANGITGSMQSAILIVSPMASGALLSLAPIEVIFFIDVVTAALAITVLLIFLRVESRPRVLEKQATSYFTDMALGFRYIRDHRYLVGFFSYLGILLFLIVPAAFLTPLQVARTFGSDVWRLTAIEIVFSSGMMAGGLLIAVFGGFRNRMRTMVASNLVMAACTIALGLAPWFWLYLAAMGVFGLMMPYFNSPSATMIQEHVEQDFLGRVFSVFSMIQTSIMPLGMLAFGPLADIVRIEWLLLGTGAFLMVHALVALGRKRLMEIGEPVGPAPEAVLSTSAATY